MERFHSRGSSSLIISFSLKTFCVCYIGYLTHLLGLGVFFSGQERSIAHTPNSTELKINIYLTYSINIMTFSLSQKSGILTRSGRFAADSVYDVSPFVTLFLWGCVVKVDARDVSRVQRT